MKAWCVSPGACSNPCSIYTISFQAPGFYKRLGWRVFGEIPCDPPGTSRVFLIKYFR
jgi:hypothetical protein